MKTFFYPCPHCGEQIAPSWIDVKAGRLHCPSCNIIISDTDRAWALDNGAWKGKGDEHTHCLLDDTLTVSSLWHEYTLCRTPDELQSWYLRRMNTDTGVIGEGLPTNWEPILFDGWPLGDFTGVVTYTDMRNGLYFNALAATAEGVCYHLDTGMTTDRDDWCWEIGALRWVEPSIVVEVPHTVPAHIWDALAIKVISHLRGSDARWRADIKQDFQWAKQWRYVAGTDGRRHWFGRDKLQMLHRGYALVYLGNKDAT